MTQIVMRWLADGRSEWLAADGRVHAGLPPPSEDLRLSVLVPAEDVLLLELPRLARSAAQLDQAVPYAIEDQLAAAVEQQHVAWASGASPERLRVAVASHERMDAWLSPLQAAGLDAEALLPETLALPVAERAALLVEGERGVVRLDDARGLALEAEALMALAPTLPTPVDVWLIGAASPPLAAHEQHRPTSVLAALADGAKRAPVNLLQGRYAPRRRLGGARKGWQLAAGLAITALLLVLLSAWIDYYKLSQHVAAQQDEMAALYRQAVPGASSIEQPAQQLQSVLAGQGRGRGDAALLLLARTAPALAADTRVSLETLDYREGRLELGLQVADVAGLDALRQRLQAAGLAAEITGSTPGTQGVQGRLRIAGQAPEMGR